MSVKPDSERLQPIEQTNNLHATLHEYNQNLTHQTLLAILLSWRGLMDGIRIFAHDVDNQPLHLSIRQLKANPLGIVPIFALRADPGQHAGVLGIH